MSGDQLDLDAIEAQARHWDHLIRDDPDTTLALVAEVRRLREDLSKAHFIVGTHAMRAIGVEPPA